MVFQMKRENMKKLKPVWKSFKLFWKSFKRVCVFSCSTFRQDGHILYKTLADQGSRFEVYITSINGHLYRAFVLSFPYSHGGWTMLTTSQFVRSENIFTHPRCLRIKFTNRVPTTGIYNSVNIYINNHKYYNFLESDWSITPH